MDPLRLPGGARAAHQGRGPLRAHARRRHVPRPELAGLHRPGDPLPRLAVRDAGLRAAHDRRAHGPGRGRRRAAVAGPSHVGRVRALDGAARRPDGGAARQPARSLGRPAVAVGLVPDESRVAPPDAAVFALVMLAGTPAGDAYTFAEYERMFRNAGFARSELHDLAPSPQRAVISYR